MEERELEGIVILDLDGRLNAGPACGLLRDRITALAGAAKYNVILNLKSCEFIDSTGLGALVVSYTTLTRMGGALKLLNLSKRHIELLVLTKLTTIFEIYDDEQHAINSFFPNREVKQFDILSFVKSHGKS